jgi:hypothetical protein
MYSLYEYPFADTMFYWPPWLPEQYYNYMKSVWQDGTHLTYGGDGHLGPVQVDHALTGDPVAGSGWLEPQTGLDAVLYGMASSGPFNFFPGDTLTLELAYVFARDYEGGHLSSVSLLKERIGRIRWFYENDSTPCGTSWTSTLEYESPVRRLAVSPNPARHEMTFPGLDHGKIYSCRIFDARGVLVKENHVRGGQKIDISALQPGAHIIRLFNFEKAYTAKFIKID